MSDDPEARTRRELGIAVFTRTLAVPEHEVLAALTDRVGPVFAEEALQAAGGAAWWHPALTGRDRSIAVITALAAQGVAGDRLDTHIRLAKENGLDEDALTALMALLANYVGQPRASLAMGTVRAAHAAAAAAAAGSGDEHPQGPEQGR